MFQRLRSNGLQSTSQALPLCNCVIDVTVVTVETVVTPVIVTAAASSETRSLPVPGSCEIGRVIASRIAYNAPLTSVRLTSCVPSARTLA